MKTYLKRHEFNRKILEKLSEIVDKYPDWRFNQILENVGITDGYEYESARPTLNFYEESVDTYKKIEKY